MRPQLLPTDTLTPELGTTHCSYNSLTSHSAASTRKPAVPSEFPMGTKAVLSASVLGVNTERSHGTAQRRLLLRGILL